MTIREIKTDEIVKTVADLCFKANTVLRADVLAGIKEAYQKEQDGSPAKKMLEILLENADIAEKERIPICQDTGMVTVFVEIGKDVRIPDGDISTAVNNGVKKAYEEHYFRKSVVEDPIDRKNTGTNTPAVLHLNITDSDELSIMIMPKGFGSENKGRMIMLNPTCDLSEIVNFCVETVVKAGPDACPPYVMGIGLGGTMEQCALLAKKALLRPVGGESPKPHIAELEQKIKEEVNALEIGVMGVGGPSTVIGVNIETAPTHIAGLPVAVNISCHALRSAGTTI